MKILLICTEKLPVPAVRGGAIQTYIDGVSSHLKNKHDLTILGTTDSSLPEDETVNNIRYVRKPGGLIEVYREGVKEFLNDNTFDVIHIFNRPRLVLPVRESAPNARIILSMHNDMFKPEKIDQEEAASVVEELDKIITVSDYIGRTISDRFPKAKAKLKTIYSGVDISQFVPPKSDQAKEMRQKIRKEHNLENKKVILFAGRLSPNKGVDVLIRAMPDVAKKHPDAALVIVGSKWFSVNEVTDYIGYVRALAARLPIPVINTGFVHPTKIQEWFAASDVFVCTSQWQEPLARVHYEAMASGLPIITTNRGGNAEVINQNENGFVIDYPEQPDPFVEHLTSLLSNPSLCEKLGSNGRKLAEKHYTWDRVINEIQSVWDEVENRIKQGIAVKEVDQVNEVDQRTEVNSVQSSELEEVIEDLNKQVASDGEGSFENGAMSFSSDEKTTPIEDVIEDLNEQVASDDETSIEEASIAFSSDEKTTSIEDVIEDLNEQVASDEEDSFEDTSVAFSSDGEATSIEDVIEDLNEQVASDEENSSESIANELLEKPIPRKKRLRKLFLSELPKQEDLLDILLSRVQQKTEIEKNDDTEHEKDAVNAVMTDIYSLLMSKHSPTEKKKEFIETVNDITTAKLFQKLESKKQRNQRRRRGL
ncbi:glycosyltransferase [Halalkalibacter alkaliphilus]|uniref:Glycosyltransferase n=1 Tax=Halalkalibacter alkaliphilus TaxID=2917993 RepID=A0A9X2CSI5_9BACI|nr:glycosyltransferase [Halalkalibacter alkaliphilus]MCL7747423.1 glycosyltransferase [Halalkalibacter alkaliphilus]